MVILSYHNFTLMLGMFTFISIFFAFFVIKEDQEAQDDGEDEVELGFFDLVKLVIFILMNLDP